MLRISVFWLSHILFGMLLRHALNCSHLHRFDGGKFFRFDGARFRLFGWGAQCALNCLHLHRFDGIHFTMIKN